MTSQVWQYDSIEKYVIIMGQMINNISVNVENAERKDIETFRVPVTYGPREKVIAEANRPSIDDPSNPANVALTLPRISFENTGLTYDSSRMTSATQKVKLGEHSYIYTPAPWNFAFNVSILAKSSRICNRILEQLIPRLTPALSITFIPFAAHPEYTKDVIIELQSVQPRNEYEGDFMQRQIIGIDLQFNLKAWLFGPTTDSTRITRVAIKYDDLFTNKTLEETSIEPGLTANNEPTTDKLSTVPRNTILPTDNYGYITDYAATGD